MILKGFNTDRVLGKIFWTDLAIGFAHQYFGSMWLWARPCQLSFPDFPFPRLDNDESYTDISIDKWTNRIDA